MTRGEAMKRVAELSRLLREYQHAYHVLDRPLVSDREYDRLFDELVRLETEHPGLALPDSPARRVGSDLTQELPEVPHSLPVLSLDKAYSDAEVAAWVEKTARNAGEQLAFVCEEKIDGSSIVLYYEKGVLARAVTRGNGLVGNDVTANVMTIGAVPLRLPEELTLAARGEIFLPRSRFAAVNDGMEAPYANPRNLAAGTLRRVKSSEAAAVPLDIFVYEGFFDPPAATHREALERLAGLGFRLNPSEGWFSDAGDLDAVRRAHPSWTVGALADIGAFLAAERGRRAGLDYEIDGIVVKVDELAVRERLGATGHHPRWEIAYKFESPEDVTTVTAIEVQVGRTGRITPVARVEPVKISGATISNVTLHNQDYVDLLELAVGDKVAVSRRGDVIPAVERVLEKNEDRQRYLENARLVPVVREAAGEAGRPPFLRELTIARTRSGEGSRSSLPGARWTSRASVPRPSRPSYPGASSAMWKTSIPSIPERCFRFPDLARKRSSRYGRASRRAGNNPFGWCSPPSASRKSAARSLSSSSMQGGATSTGSPLSPTPVAPTPFLRSTASASVRPACCSRNSPRRGCAGASSG